MKHAFSWICPRCNEEKTEYEDNLCVQCHTEKAEDDAEAHADFLHDQRRDDALTGDDTWPEREKALNGDDT